MTGILSHLFSASPRPARFILLAHARSGSNLVAYSLAAHSQVAMLSEVLSQWPNVRQRCAKGPRHSASYEDGADGARFLDEKVFLHHAPRGVQHCGFKIFYDHARFTPAVKTAWDYILENRDIRIVHLKRRDFLASKVSLDVALKTGQWLLENNHDGARHLVPPFTADPADYEYHFNQLHAAQSWAAGAFAHHNVMEIEYERDLFDAFPATMARVFAFLGLDPETPQIRLQKQASHSPAEQLTNFAELREHFRHSIYEQFFQEPSSR